MNTSSYLKFRELLETRRYSYKEVVMYHRFADGGKIGIFIKDVDGPKLLEVGVMIMNVENYKDIEAEIKSTSNLV